jgi:urate oxidase
MNSLQSPEVSDYSEEVQYDLWQMGLKQLIVVPQIWSTLFLFQIKEFLAWCQWSTHP